MTKTPPPPPPSGSDPPASPSGSGPSGSAPSTSRALLAGLAAAVLIAVVGALFARGGVDDAPPGDDQADGQVVVGDAEGADSDAAGPDAGGPEPGGAQAAGEPLPQVTLTTFDGQSVDVADFTGGQPLVLNFFASWCPPCVAEMRDAFAPAHATYGDEVRFLGVALQDDPDAALGVVEQTGVDYELAQDPEGRLFTAISGFGMPTTLYISADGRIVARDTGAITPSQLEARLDELLAEAG